MLSKIFSIMCISSTLYAILTGNIPALSDAILDGAAKAVTISIGLLGINCLFTGIMEVLRRSGAVKLLCRIIRPLLKFAFPDTYRNGNGVEEIAANIAANMLGIGNAATPMALSAMQKMKENADNTDTASDDMVTLSVLNSASVNLFPSSLIAMRRLCGSSSSGIIVFPIWIVSSASALFAILLSRTVATVLSSFSEKRCMT